jgi:hypothetical protein
VPLGFCWECEKLADELCGAATFLVEADLLLVTVDFFASAGFSAIFCRLKSRMILEI